MNFKLNASVYQVMLNVNCFKNGKKFKDFFENVVTGASNGFWVNLQNYSDNFCYAFSDSFDLDNFEIAVDQFDFFLEAFTDFCTTLEKCVVKETESHSFDSPARIRVTCDFLETVRKFNLGVMKFKCYTDSSDKRFDDYSAFVKALDRLTDTATSLPKSFHDFSSFVKKSGFSVFNQPVSYYKEVFSTVKEFTRFLLDRTKFVGKKEGEWFTLAEDIPAENCIDLFTSFVECTWKLTGLLGEHSGVYLELYRLFGPEWNSKVFSLKDLGDAKEVIIFAKKKHYLVSFRSGFNPKYYEAYRPVSCSLIGPGMCETFGNLPIGFLYSWDSVSVSEMSPKDCYSTVSSVLSFSNLMEACLKGKPIHGFNSYSDYPSIDALLLKDFSKFCAETLIEEKGYGNYNEVVIEGGATPCGLFIFREDLQSWAEELSAVSEVWDLPLFIAHRLGNGFYTEFVPEKKVKSFLSDLR